MNINVKEKIKIEDLIKKYYKISKDDIDYFFDILTFEDIAVIVKVALARNGFS